MPAVQRPQQPRLRAAPRVAARALVEQHRHRDARVDREEGVLAGPEQGDDLHRVPRVDEVPRGGEHRAGDAAHPVGGPHEEVHGRPGPGRRGRTRGAQRSSGPRRRADQATASRRTTAGGGVGAGCGPGSTRRRHRHLRVGRGEDLHRHGLPDPPAPVHRERALHGPSGERARREPQDGGAACGTHLHGQVPDAVAGERAQRQPGEDGTPAHRRGHDDGSVAAARSGDELPDAPPRPVPEPHPEQQGVATHLEPAQVGGRPALDDPQPEAVVPGAEGLEHEAGPGTDRPAVVLPAPVPHAPELLLPAGLDGEVPDVRAARERQLPDQAARLLAQRRDDLAAAGAGAGDEVAGGVGRAEHDGDPPAALEAHLGRAGSSGFSHGHHLPRRLRTAAQGRCGRRGPTVPTGGPRRGA